MLQPVLHDIEKKIIIFLKQAKRPNPDEEEIQKSTGLGMDQVRRGIEWLRHKGLVNVVDEVSVAFSLGGRGLMALDDGVPERRLLEMLKGGQQNIVDIQLLLGGDFGPAMGIARKNGWVISDGKTIKLARTPDRIGEEDLLRRIAASSPLTLDEIKDTKSLESLRRRPEFIVEESTKRHRVSLSPKSISFGETVVAEDKLVIRTLDRDPIDVTADAPAVYPARTHPLKDVIGEIREAFVALGFTEISGNLCQPGFWNFDALFTPQDHPAREMQDTFYLDSSPYGNVATKREIAAVSAEHRRHWGSKWSPAESRRAVLRTHTTCVTIKHIARTRPESARVFSLGRVFRNEKQSYKHLAEFNQVEGVVVGRGVTLRGLMGIQKEFYRRMGMHKVKFWPTFFPYTEPSLQSMVYNDKLGKWIELFGMGIFRPEVTAPLGIRGRVLAWGGGIERIAMLRYGISDVRELYANRLAWLRGAA